VDVPCKGGAAGKACPAHPYAITATLFPAEALASSGPARWTRPRLRHNWKVRESYSLAQVTIRELLPWMRDHLLAERPELFMKDDSVCVGPNPLPASSTSARSCAIRPVHHSSLRMVGSTACRCATEVARDWRCARTVQAPGHPRARQRRGLGAHVRDAPW